MSDASKPGALRRLLTGLPLALISPLLIAIAGLALALSDLFARVRSKPNLPQDQLPSTDAASIVIPNWNGRDLLEKYLPSVIAAAERVPGSEVIVVDNGSEDGSAQYLRETFPQVRVVALERNLGFGGGSNAGFREATNDVVVLLNSDMRVQPDFLAPLLAGFIDGQVFSVSCQIFLSDPARRREETGLTQAWWERGALRVTHRTDEEIKTLYPCFYGGGGSCAYDRKKFFELGGFDELLAPFYLEDTDLGFMAWKRGWKNFYQPASVVFHEHRGTIGRKFSESYIQGVLKKNYLLFTWKNVHEWGRVLPHLWFAWVGALLSWVVGDSPQRASLNGLARAVLQLPKTLGSRTRAMRLAAISDTEAFRRPLGGFYWDAFGKTNVQATGLNVLFVSPYPIYPPVHGGAVFMYQTVRELARQGARVHAVILIEHPDQLAEHRELDEICASAEYVLRTQPPKQPGSLMPHAVREFRNPDIQWLIQRKIFLGKMDVLQFEYTMMGQYGIGFKRVPSFLFEHDVYFQSVARRLPYIRGLAPKMSAVWEYLASLRYELKLLPQFDRVQVCTPDNESYLERFLPQLHGRLDPNLRAGIDTSRYHFAPDGREPLTMLFLGSFRHTPNQEALTWFVESVLPQILVQEPDARLVVIGSEPPANHPLAGTPGVEFAGFIDDVRDALARYGVFVCPILSGSGIRVKLLEAFAAGIPVVSTRLGAEGLVQPGAEVCLLADEANDFARGVVELFRNAVHAQKLAIAARDYVVRERDLRTMTAALLACYGAEIERKSNARSV